MHGGQLMYHQIQEAISRVTIPPTNAYHRWVGVFPRLEVLLIIKEYLEDKTFHLFYVDKQIDCLSSKKW